MMLFHPVTRRSGVTARVMQRNRRVQTPVSFVRSLSGFALRFPVSMAQTSQASGPSEARKTTDFRMAECGLRIADLNNTDIAGHRLWIANSYDIELNHCGFDH